MSKPILLANISMGTSYIVSGFNPERTDYADKLYKMGFVEGTPVSLAPVEISDPLIIQIRGSRVALRKTEARQILVKEATDA